MQLVNMLFGNMLSLFPPHEQAQMVCTAVMCFGMTFMTVIITELATAFFDVFVSFVWCRIKQKQRKKKNEEKNM